MSDLLGHYEIGWHSSDVDVCHVAFVLPGPNGPREDLFDVQLYTMEPGCVDDGARAESLVALHRLLRRANLGLAVEAENAERVKSRLEELRAEIRAERISYGDLAELQDLAPDIEPGDVELLEWAGVPEQAEEEA